MGCVGVSLLWAAPVAEANTLRPESGQRHTLPCPPPPHTPTYTSTPRSQEELEAYDRHQRLLEDNLDSKTAEIIQLRRAALEAAAGQLHQVRGAMGGGRAPCTPVVSPALS